MDMMLYNALHNCQVFQLPCCQFDQINWVVLQRRCSHFPPPEQRLDIVDGFVFVDNGCCCSGAPS